MTNKPIYYYSPRSPPCRAVLLAAAALGVELDFRPTIVMNGDNLTPEFLKLNPLHTIPVLDDNGVVISDSHVICSYLADKYGVDDTLYPRDKIKRMQVDALLFFDCGHLFSRVRFMVEPVMFFGADDIPQDKITYMQKAYDGLEKSLATTKFLCGNEMTIADLCCVASVSSSMSFAPIEQAKFPKVIAWVERLAALPYYQKNNGDGAQILYNFVNEKMLENRKAKESA